MKKFIMKLMLVLTLACVLSLGTSALADNVVSRGETQVGITFTGSSVTGTADDEIPTGKTPMKIPSAADTAERHGRSGGTQRTQNGRAGATATTPNTSVAQPRKHGLWAAKAAAADMLAGRLPQTNEVQSLLADMVGILLLLVVILAAIVYWQARLLRERE
ncbi:hypothetical protein [Levilactobacillus suantsaiihabitans]|uniref:LPXTG cell wall anchor domain-containing protein n=1 Tax=Levilactobacillus suantsaiihabitans TaxID=2487722 RepID=A0A4Z0JAJ8_9LACO|nr:hypothetical protein [Levilactobacillus suantsaiihabitans]TGD19731.1 hypothetical protein EGT51_02540 [Levilactobacillus suantsaiihabitans]